MYSFSYISMSTWQGDPLADLWSAFQLRSEILSTEILIINEVLNGPAFTVAHAIKILKIEGSITI